MEAILEKYNELNTSELLERRYRAREAVGVDVTIFITLVFGYLTIAYLAGKKLGRFETISLRFLGPYWMQFSTGLRPVAGVAPMVVCRYVAIMFMLFGTLG